MQNYFNVLSKVLLLDKKIGFKFSAKRDREKLFILSID